MIVGASLFAVFLTGLEESDKESPWGPKHETKIDNEAASYTLQSAFIL